MASVDTVIVGAGPVGLITALILTQRGHKVVILEKQPAIEQSPRAIVYFPTSLATLAEAGIAKDAMDAGLVLEDGAVWRRPVTHEKLAQMEGPPPPADPDAPPMVGIILGQHLLAEIAKHHLSELGVEVRFGVGFEGLTQSKDSVQVTAIDQQTGESIKLDASFVIGADGARSQVRKSLDLPFEGFSHDAAFVAVNFRYPKIQATGFGTGQFIVDPKQDPAESNFAIILRTGKTDVWRCAYGDASKFTDDELKARLPAKLKAILPLNPDESEFEVLKAQPYRVHQRCVPSYVKGRVLLAGDAAHINNPVGGLGLNCGISDAHLAALSVSSALQQTDEREINNVLEDYNKQRRSAFVDFVNPTSIDNFRRLRDPSIEAQRELRDNFFGFMNADRAANVKNTMKAVRLAQGIPGFPRI